MLATTIRQTASRHFKLRKHGGGWHHTAPAIFLGGTYG